MKIELPYSPNITRETISAIFYKHFPQLEQVAPWLNHNTNILALKKSSFNIVTVAIRHKPNRNKTILQVTPNLMPSALVNLGVIGLFINVIARGDFPERVYEALQSEILSLQGGTFNLRPMPDLEESIRKSKRGTKAALSIYLVLLAAVIIFVIIAVSLM